MAEVTRIFTVEITMIAKGNVDDILPKDEAEEAMKKSLKDHLDADDVVVTNVQDFIRE